jgi:hypothetical protein
LKFRLNSPIGIALTVAGVVLALSPEMRQAARRALVKGTAAVLGAVDSAKHTAIDITEEAAETVSQAAETIDAIEARVAEPFENAVDTVMETAEAITHPSAQPMPH